LDYQEIIECRRRLSIAPYKSLADVEFDGPWVTPYQISSKSPDGPVLVALLWAALSAQPDEKRSWVTPVKPASRSHPARSFH
jgi:hypothetical protein